MALCSQNVGHARAHSDALRKREAVPLVIRTAACYIGQTGGPKRHKWFEHAVSAGPDLGDAWGLVA